MKKVILSALVVGSLLATSCKKAKEAGSALKEGTEAVANGAVDAAKDGANAVANGAADVANGAAGVVKDGANAVANGAEAVVDGAKDGANAVVDGAKNIAGKAVSAITGVSIPEFKDPAVGAHLQAYSEYAKDYIAAGTDAYKNTELVKKGADLLAKGKTIVAGLDAESATKFKSVMTAIQSKMAPAK